MFLIGVWYVVSLVKELNKQKVLQAQKILGGGRNQWQECITLSRKLFTYTATYFILEQMLNFKQKLLLLCGSVQKPQQFQKRMTFDSFPVALQSGNTLTHRIKQWVLVGFQAANLRDMSSWKNPSILYNWLAYADL